MVLKSVSLRPKAVMLTPMLYICNYEDHCFFSSKTVMYQTNIITMVIIHDVSNCYVTILLHLLLLGAHIILSS